MPYETKLGVRLFLIRDHIIKVILKKGTLKIMQPGKQVYDVICKKLAH